MQIVNLKHIMQYSKPVKSVLLLCFVFRFVENAPKEFLTHSAFPAVMQCALAGLLLDHREANASVTKFLRTIIECRDTNMVSKNIYRQ